MRELWAGDQRWVGSRYYCPCVVNDDGSPVSDAQCASPKVSFFHQPDHGYGEKSVSHITVADYHVYQQRRDGEPLYPMSFFDDNFQLGSYKHGRFRATCRLNTVILEYWKDEDFDDDPTQADWFIKWKYTRPENTYRFYVDFKHQEYWCSEAYAREYSMPALHGVSDAGEGASCHSMYAERVGHDLFERYMLTPEQAWKVYCSVESSHTVPAGLTSELYRNAMNSITCNTNSIANILGVVDTIKDVKNGNFGALLSDIPKYIKSKQLKKAASSSWLGYRYAYNTTKSDIAEYQEKLRPLLNYKKGTHIVRSASIVNEGTAHCKVVYSDRALNSVQQLYVMLKRTGLCLDAYNAWDMIPLSFVADWFLPIGDFLEDFSQNWVADSAIFDIATVTTSWKWSHTIRDDSGGYDISYYSRTVTSEPPEFESYSEDPSTKTILKRVVDAAALIVG